VRHLDQPTIGDKSAFVYCLEACPWRYPDWRWKIALLSLETKLPRRAETRDSLVRQVRQVLKESRTSQPSYPPGNQGGFKNALWQAAGIHRGEPLFRAKLEALVLADVSVGLIADRCEVPCETVSTYERIFFDVRDRLEARSFVLHCLIGPALGEGFSLNDLWALWRFVGYMRGRHYLCALIQTFPGTCPFSWQATLPTSPEERRLVLAGRRLVFTMCLRNASPSLRDLACLSRLSTSYENQLEEQEALHRIRHGIMPTGDLYDELHTIYSRATTIGVDRSEATASESPTPGETEAPDRRSAAASGLAGGSETPVRSLTAATRQTAVKRFA
jgi:hypothetical protein